MRQAKPPCHQSKIILLFHYVISCASHGNPHLLSNPRSQPPTKNEDMVSRLNTDDTGLHPLTEWLVRRLTGPRGRQDWNRLVEAAWRHTSTSPWRTLMPTETLRDVVLAQLRPDRLPDFLRPITRSRLPRLLELHRNDDAPLGRWVPDTARGALELLASRPGLIPEDWIRALFRQRVAEAVMADALYRAIRAFSTIMPRLMPSLMPTPRFSRLGGATILQNHRTGECIRQLAQIVAAPRHQSMLDKAFAPAPQRFIRALVSRCQAHLSRKTLCATPH